MIYKVKRKYYNNLFGDNIPEALFILGGGDSINHAIKKRTLRGLITLLYKGRNPNLISGMEARIFAAVELSNYFPKAKVITMSHKAQPKGKMFLKTPPLIYAEKITVQINKKGIPLEKIISCKRSTSTLTELMELVKLSNVNLWKTVTVITNEYHIERSKLLFYLLTNPKKQSYLYKSCFEKLKTEKDKELFKKVWQAFLHAQELFQKRGTQVFFIAAEEILPEKYVFYEKVIDMVYTSEAYKNREELEEKGVQMILKGIYNFDQNNTIESYLHFMQ